MKVQIQTKRSITFTKQDVIEILQAHIEERGYAEGSYEVCSDNVPDQIVIDMVSDVQVVVDTNKDVVPQTTQFMSKGDASIGLSPNNNDPLSKLNQSTQLDSMAGIKSTQDIAVESLKDTCITSGYGSASQSESIPKTYPKGWDPFAD